MGRYNFQPQRVLDRTNIPGAKFIERTPNWIPALERIQLPAILTRTQAVEHWNETRSGRKIPTKKPSKAFRPVNIFYVEDDLRRTFFRDHPWELARPRTLLEDPHKLGRAPVWNKINPRGVGFSGENVVQRQMWLMSKGLSQSEAYDQARKEFYKFRQQEDVERRVAVEEAHATGAYFGPTAMEKAMAAENVNFEYWKDYARAEIKAAAIREQATSAANTTQNTDQQDDEDTPDRDEANKN